MAEEIDSTTAPAPETPTAPAPEKTFTQAELDRVVKERLQREREKHTDYDQLKAAADELAKIKESQLSETEKLTRRLAELEAAKTQAEARARDTLIRSAIISEAARLNFNDPEDAYRLMDIAGLKVGDDGKIEGVAEAVKQLAEGRKYLIKQAGGSLEPFNPAGGGGQLKETDVQRRQRLNSGGGQGFFDTDAASQHGGGIVWPKPKPEQ